MFICLKSGAKVVIFVEIERYYLSLKNSFNIFYTRTNHFFCFMCLSLPAKTDK